MNPFSLVRLPHNVRVERVLVNVPWLRRYARRIAASPLLPSTGLVRYGRDCLIEFNGRNSQFHAIYDQHYHAGYELETCVLLHHLLKGGGTFVDAGSNWGYFALFAASLPAYTGRCVCYEPNASTFIDLTRTVTQARLNHRVETRQLGLGAEPCELRLEATGDVSGLAKLSTEGAGEVVRVTTIDNESHPDVSFIKIDVEGMELAVLQGAERTIREQRPWLIVENFLHHQTPGITLEPIRWMQERDYAVFMPAATVRQARLGLPYHYGSPTPAASGDVDWGQMQFFRVTEANRFLLHPQLNLFGCPEEKLAALTGEILS
jgi:FkbM family methyltransferase